MTSKPSPQPRPLSPEANVANQSASVPRFQILRPPQTPLSPTQSNQLQTPPNNGVSTPSPRPTTPPQALSSEATSEGDVSEALLDTFLLQALNHPRDRITLLKLDYELERFINSPRSRLDFPPMSSYQRMIIHRVAQYFKLQHTSVEAEDGHKRVVVLFKGPESRVPDLRFADLLEQPETATKSVKIMRRPSDSQRRQETAKGNKTPGSSNKKNGAQITESELKTIEEREEAYAKARARIFSQDLNATGKNKEQDTERADKDREDKDKEKQLLEKVQALKVTERRTPNAQTPYDNYSSDVYGRRGYEEGWDTRFNAWPRPVDPAWHGGPPPDPTYWDVTALSYEAAVSTDYYTEYYDPTLPPRPESYHHPTMSPTLPRGSWPEPIAQAPRYLYAPENGTYVRAPTNVGAPVHPTPQQTPPYLPHGGVHPAPYVRHNTSNYGNDSFVNNESVLGEGEVSRGIGDEMLNGGVQNWGTNYDLSSTYSPKHTRNPVKTTSPVLNTGRQTTHTTYQPQPQPSPQQASYPGRQTYPQPKTLPTQKPHQPQTKQRYNPTQQSPLQQPFNPYYPTQKRGASPPHVVGDVQTAVKPSPSNHPQPGAGGVYMPHPQYGYYVDQPQVPIPSGVPAQWPYYAPSPISHTASLPAGAPFSAPLPPPTGEMLQQGVLDPYGIQTAPFQPSGYYHQHRYSAIAGRSNYLGEYERPPPKSKELFDPSSPSPAPRHQITTQQQGAYIGQPQSSQAQSTTPISASQLEQEQGTVSSTTSQQSPGWAPEPNSFSSDGQSKLQSYNPNSLLLPNKGIKTVKPGAALIYDYSPKTLVEATPSPPAQACPPMAVHHILEVYDLRPSEKSNKEENQPDPPSQGRRSYLGRSKELPDEQEKCLDVLKEAGATIKILSSSGSILAIFKTASAARQALENTQSPYFKLRRWNTPAATTPAPEQATKDPSKEAAEGVYAVAVDNQKEKTECSNPT